MEPAADNTSSTPETAPGKSGLREEPRREVVGDPGVDEADGADSGSIGEHEGNAVPEADAPTNGTEPPDEATGSEVTELDASAPDAAPAKKKKKKTKKGKSKKAKGTPDASPDTTNAGAKKDAAAKFGTSRGIETMFRSNYRVHMDLSAIADTKANIMISINGLILPILLGAISPKIDSNPWLLVPTSVLMVGCLVSMIFAIRSARPRVSREPVSLDQISQKGYNILFFGHFANMRRDDYEEGMAQLMSSNEDIYRNMIRDLHGLGSVLNEKYALLRTSYTVFMIAITVGVLLFIATFFLIAMGVISVPGDTLVVPYDAIPTP
ncbi:MAG: Pycsar system effector family protein [Bacteroidota bacterium]